MTIHFGDSTSIASGGSLGKILQVQHVAYTGDFVYNSTSMGNVGMSDTITPTSASSKILVMFNLNVGSNNNGNRILFHVTRDGHEDFVGNASGNRTKCSGQQSVSNPQDMRSCHISYVSSPNTTSAVIYRLQAQLQVGGGSYAYFGGSGADSNSSIEGRTPQHITLMEIGA